ncbi:hypothetical protein [Comamonas resistens]|uniref:hypothetical protein n=1 Tax=Comamonas resistens TaxID=3046670 RepID=UPI0039BD0B42
MVACKKCKTEVGKKDKVCPQCGVSRPGQGFIEGLTGLSAIVIAAVVGLTMCTGVQKESPPAPESTTGASGAAEVAQQTPQPQPEKPPVTDAETPITSKPLDLTQARELARSTLGVINEAEKSLIDGLKLGDMLGITKYVRQPLDAQLAQWPKLLESPPGDQREQFAYCKEAAMQLHSLSFSAARQQTVETKKFLDKEESDYRKIKQKCEARLNTTDSQIKASIAAEEAELKEKFGGRECLTVYDLDSATGKVIEQPKPAHCKK